jgi:hypothetical protein
MKKINQPTFHQDKDRLLYPRSAYYGHLKPANLVFNANLQEFSQRVGYISALENGGKIPPQEAYKQVKTLWKALKRSYRQLDLES